MTDVAALAVEEVLERHRFFVTWFTVGGPESALDETASCFAAGMRRIGPDGRVQTKEEIVAMLRSARSTRTESFAIRVEVRESRRLAAGLALVVYDELQSEGDHRTARRASAILGTETTAPIGVAWQHLQETWIDPASSAPPG